MHYIPFFGGNISTILHPEYTSIVQPTSNKSQVIKVYVILEMPPADFDWIDWKYIQIIYLKR